MFICMIKFCRIIFLYICPASVLYYSNSIFHGNKLSTKMSIFTVFHGLYRNLVFSYLNINCPPSLLPSVRCLDIYLSLHCMCWESNILVDPEMFGYVLQIAILLLMNFIYI